MAGQSADYLVKQLQEYKNGTRVNPIMVGMVAPLSPQDMEDLSRLFRLAADRPWRGRPGPGPGG
ncbi:MAG: hypothetical protein MZV65_20210 [Chromatiales bacterium]|nr:hypothetical protein [Chromatiales bacterium]